MSPIFISRTTLLRVEPTQRGSALPLCPPGQSLSRTSSLCLSSACGDHLRVAGTRTWLPSSHSCCRKSHEKNHRALLFEISAAPRPVPRPSSGFQSRGDAQSCHCALRAPVFLAAGFSAHSLSFPVSPHAHCSRLACRSLRQTPSEPRHTPFTSDLPAGLCSDADSSERCLGPRVILA